MRSGIRFTRPVHDSRDNLRQLFPLPRLQCKTTTAPTESPFETAKAIRRRHASRRQGRRKVQKLQARTAIHMAYHPNRNEGNVLVDSEIRRPVQKDPIEEKQPLFDS